MKRVLIVLALVLLAWGVVAQAEEPASQDEATGKIIATTEGPQAEPASQDEAAGKIIATTEGPQVYVVRPGDTLWGICERFFDTPWVWPKLWEQNSFIANPHCISPGLKLTLYHAALPVAQPAQFTAEPEPEPEPEAPPAPPAPRPEAFRLYLEDVGYLSREKAEVVGTIFEAKDPLKLMVGEGDTVFVQTPGLRPAVGDLFRVVHISKDKVRHPVTGANMGYAHTFPAVLRITEVDEDVVTACISQSREAIAVGDGFVPWFPMPERVVLRRGGLRLEGRLVAGQTYLQEIGQGNLVFLDVGSEDGIEPGRVFGVWREVAAPDGRPPSEPPEATRLGEAVVVLVRPDTSTAFITNSEMEMAAGDLVIPEP